MVVHKPEWVTDTARYQRAFDLWNAGTRIAEIALAVGATPNSIIGYRFRHKWPPHPNQPQGQETRTRQTAELREARAHALANGLPPPVRPPRKSPKPKAEPQAPEPHPTPPVRVVKPTGFFKECQWVIQLRPLRQCGNPTSPGSAYCPHHHAIACHRVRDRREDAA
jgi:hypothetical protein